MAAQQFAADSGSQKSHARKLASAFCKINAIRSSKPRAQHMSTSMSPEAVIQRQLDAYNARDIDALLSIYAEDAETFEHPATLLAAGSAALRARFAARLQEPNLHARLLSRIVMGNIVVDCEQVTRTFSDGTGTLDLIMIYEVRSERIAKSWVIIGAKL